MQLDELYQLIQDHKHGGSTHGVSMYETAAKCGRLSNLKEKFRERTDAQRAEALLRAEEPDALEVGTAYHALQENGMRGQLEDIIWDQTDAAYDMHFIEAVRLYRGYNEAWGSCLNRWGAKLVGVEVPLGTNSQALQHEVLRRMGAPLTGRADAIIEIVDVEAARENTGLDLEPGRYLLDHKTAGQKNAKQDWQFTFGNQSIAYAQLYNIEHPEAPIKGFLFDLIVRHATLRKEPQLDKSGKVKAGKSFHAFLAQALPEDVDTIRALVEYGLANKAADRPNVAHCFDGFRPCVMFELGICQRK